MGKIKEFIKSFIEPRKEDQSFDEVALAAGLKTSEISELKKAMEGVSWANCDREDSEETKKIKEKKKIVKGQEQSPKVTKTINQTRGEGGREPGE